MSREGKAVKFAKDQLGVDEVYAEALDVHAKLEQSLTDIVRHSKEVRRLNDDIEAREVDVIIELRAANPDASGAAVERMAKEAYVSDQRLKELRETLRAEQHQHDLCQSAITASKYRLRILSARLNELGGLTAFYAATKGGA